MPSKEGRKQKEEERGTFTPPLFSPSAGQKWTGKKSRRKLRCQFRAKAAAFLSLPFPYPRSLFPPLADPRRANWSGKKKKRKGGEGEDDRKRGIGTFYGKGQKNLRGTDVSGRKGFAAYL